MRGGDRLDDATDLGVEHLTVVAEHGEVVGVVVGRAAARRVGVHRREHDVPLRVQVAVEFREPGQHGVVHGLEDHAHVDAHVGHALPAGLGEHERPRTGPLMQSLGALLEAGVPHHPDVGDRPGGVGNADADEEFGVEVGISGRRPGAERGERRSQGRPREHAASSDLHYRSSFRRSSLWGATNWSSVQKCRRYWTPVR